MKKKPTLMEQARTLFLPPSLQDLKEHTSFGSLLAPRTKKILLLDDNEYFIEIFRRHCEAGFKAEIVAVHTIAAASELLLDTDTLVVDFAVFDVKLTNGSGVELYGKVAKLWPKLPVIFLTGYDTPELRLRVEKYGPARVHSKDRINDQPFLTMLLEQMGVPRRSTDSQPPFSFK